MLHNLSQNQADQPRNAPRFRPLAAAVHLALSSLLISAPVDFAHAQNSGTTSASDAPATAGPEKTLATVVAEASADASATVTMDKSTIKNVQTSLKKEGHAVSTDGVWGPRTASALRDFQSAKGLPVTGTLNSKTLAG